MPNARKPRSKAKPPELKVIFDTSVIHVKSEADLLKREVVDLINESRNFGDVTLSWYIPEVVLNERRFQMVQAALGLLPSIQRVEFLLGHNLNITEETLRAGVEANITRQLEALGVSLLPLDTAGVDWARLISDSTYRNPPFAPTGEKGFRDALVTEAFLQLVAASPTTPRVCRIALVTGDSLMTQAAEARTSGLGNVRILGTLEDLKGLISTLVSEVSEEFVARIREKAKQYFFQKDNEESLYFKLRVRKQIGERFPEVLKAMPEGYIRREEGTWWISDPRFVRKERQRVYWVTRISAETKAFRPRPIFEALSPLAALIAGYRLPQFVGSPPTAIQPPTAQSAGAALGPSEQGVKGKSVFEVTWSVSVSTRGTLRAPRIDDIKHIETTWETSGEQQ